MQKIVRLGLKNVRLILEVCNRGHRVSGGKVGETQTGDDVGAFKTFDLNRQLTTIGAGQRLQCLAFGDSFTAIANQHFARHEFRTQRFLTNTAWLSRSEEHTSELQ